MTATLHHKDYEGSIEVSTEGRCLHGKLLFVDDLVTYEGKDFDSLDSAFRDAVDDYLQFCADIGKSPEKPCKGVFNVRVKPNLHRALVVRAFHDEQTLNELVSIALEAYVSSATIQHNHHHRHEHVLDKHVARVHWTSSDSQPIFTVADVDTHFDPTSQDTPQSRFEDIETWFLKNKTENSVPF